MTAILEEEKTTLSADAVTGALRFLILTGALAVCLLERHIGQRQSVLRAA